MLLDKLTPREKGILYFLIAVILLSVAYNFLAESLYKYWKNTNREISLMKGKLSQSLSIIRNKENIDKEYAVYADRLKFRGTDEQEITTMLNGIETIARNANLKIVNMKPKPPQAKEFYVRYMVEIETESDMTSLMKFIYDTKNSPLLLKVDRLGLNTKMRQADVVIRATLVISRISIK